VVAPAAVPAAITIAAAADLNPNAEGRPSPVVVRIYQLKADGMFSTVDYEPLFEDEQKALGADLISREEYTLTPSERRTIEVPVDVDTRFVGAAAAYRDIRNAEWRVLAPVGRKAMTVEVQRARVVLSVAE
jgi:type VI secretion system protein VasD